MARYLIVANRTLGGEKLEARIDELVAAGPVSFFIAVPVTGSEATTTRDRDVPRVRAQARLNHELARMRARGIDATGELLDSDIVEHVRALTREHVFDAVLVSTLPPRISRWLRMDLPTRLAKALSIPVTHVEGPEGPRNPKTNSSEASSR